MGKWIMAHPSYSWGYDRQVAVRLLHVGRVIDAALCNVADPDDEARAIRSLLSRQRMMDKDQLTWQGFEGE